jgi:phytoene desaturase
VVPYVEQAFGAWYVRGGLRQLVLALHDRAVLRGAEIRTGCDVAQIVLEGGRVAGVRLATGQRVPADVVVANADAATVYRTMLPGAEGAAARKALDRATPSLSGFVLLLALRGRTPDLAHHTELFPDDYDAEFDAVFGRSASPVNDPTVYVSAPDDPGLRPDDQHESWFVLVNAPRHGRGPGAVDWRAPGLAESYADRVLSVMAARGLDVRDRVLWRVVRTPADLEDETRAPGGAIYGTSSNGARAAFLRPANRGPVPGLFLAGGSAHPGGGLPLVGLSAAIVAELVGPA